MRFVSNARSSFVLAINNSLPLLQAVSVRPQRFFTAYGVVAISSVTNPKIPEFIGLDFSCFFHYEAFRLDCLIPKKYLLLLQQRCFQCMTPVSIRRKINLLSAVLRTHVQNRLNYAEFTYQRAINHMVNHLWFLPVFVIINYL